MKSFEYYVHTICSLIGTNDHEDELNRFGKHGWELISVIIDDNRDHIAFFKRENLNERR